MQRSSVTYEFTKIERSYDIKDNVIEQINYNGNIEQSYYVDPKDYETEEISYNGN
jgi:hypothetical protein